MSTELAIALGLITWIFIVPAVFVGLRWRVVRLNERMASDEDVRATVEQVVRPIEFVRVASSR